MNFPVGGHDNDMIGPEDKIEERVSDAILILPKL